MAMAAEWPTWAVLVTAFFESRRERSASPRTLEAYGEDMAKFAAWYGAQRGGASPDPVRVTALELADYRIWLRGRNKPATVNRRLASIRAMLAWAVGENLIPRSPAEHLRRVPSTLLGPRALDRQQLARLVDAASRCRHRDAVLIVFLAQTGLRISEALSLTWDNLRLGRDAATVEVRRGKGGKYREVPLNATAKQALRQWRDVLGSADATGSAPLFPSRSGRPLARRTAEEAFVRYSRLAGIDPPATPHTLRHTFCKALIDAGISLDRVAVLAGHAGLDTTARYTRPTLADLERAVRRLDV